MAKLVATNYEDLVDLFKKKNRLSLPIGHNTTATWEPSEGAPIISSISIHLHGHEIVRLNDNGQVWFNLRSFATKTTCERVNQFLPDNTHVSIKKGYPYFANPVPLMIDSHHWYCSNMSSGTDTSTEPVSEQPKAPESILSSWGELKVGMVLSKGYTLPIGSMVVDADGDIWEQNNGPDKWNLQGEPETYPLDHVITCYSDVKLIAIGSGTTAPDIKPILIDPPVVESADEDADLWPMEAV